VVVPVVVETAVVEELPVTVTEEPPTEAEELPLEVTEELPIEAEDPTLAVTEGPPLGAEDPPGEEMEESPVPVATAPPELVTADEPPDDDAEPAEELAAPVITGPEVPLPADAEIADAAPAGAWPGEVAVEIALSPGTVPELKLALLGDGVKEDPEASFYTKNCNCVDNFELLL